MRIPDSLVEKLLSKGGDFSKEQLAGLRKQAAAEKQPLQDVVIKSNLVTEKELTKLYADEIEVPFVEIKAAEISHEVLKQLPERIARQYNAVIFGIDKQDIKQVAMEDPDDIQALNFLQKQLGNKLKIHITTSSLLQAALDQYRGTISSELTKVITNEEDADDNEEEVDESDLAEDSPVAQTVNILIEYGIKSGASDVHIEPREDHVVVRYRIDGLLREANKLPRKLLGSLVSRIKILSNLKIDEHRAPQDGRFKIEVSGQIYALRVSTLPILDGEKVVMRILNESSKAADFTELGFWGTALADLKQAITQPHGMVLVTGPTGSGKSTTLFSVLSSLNTPNVNISTVEDTIEYHIVGANQTQVNPVAGMTFTNGLRALLRQDPNIIMVGEIRDGETADLAVQAALTGHLVFSTLHTNNAATCLPRLLDMGVEPFLIASTVRVVIGQRLVRRLCIDCREAFVPDAALLKHLDEAFHLNDNGGLKRLHELEAAALKDGIDASTGSKDKTSSELSTSPSAITKLWKAHDTGCDSCGHSGYKGRIGIYEVLSNTSAIQKLIVSNSTSENLEQTATGEGMLTMQLDGFIKALRGQTTIEEVLRVTAQE
ncbi:secretion system protein E [Candidatus Saccharibacteria bacterium CG_4_10_14_0_2_um_filter_52_9]|nr:MAG: secretion system protein E [Candidatus Saccharibacteria bacterium CG_4_10_14_0_2_um_filter_52_9]